MTNHIDPVCDIQVEEKVAAGFSEHDGVTYYFHSEECLIKFYQHPEQYVDKSGKEKLNDAPQVMEPSEKKR
ncbi:MAG: YHS domain-containing protein [Deltaproteobacteria bacterium]|nr:YHS domain-containing protein [Deltaproteobacteria bacterium]